MDHVGLLRHAGVARPLEHDLRVDLVAVVEGRLVVLVQVADARQAQVGDDEQAAPVLVGDRAERGRRPL